jgi:CcmD family protein
MMKKINVLIGILILLATQLQAQIDTIKVTAKTFSAEASAIKALSGDGKIYIVIIVIAIILIGLFFYLWRLDKKITKLERETK